MSAVLKKSDDEILEIVQGLRVGYKLKRTPRYNTKRDLTVHNESVADHVFALHYLARYFMLVEVLPRGLDLQKVQDIITFHDFGEIPGGDKPYHIKTPEDEAREREDAKSVFLLLPLEIRSIAQENWQDYEQRGSLEAQFVNALDKIEPCFELHDPINEKTLKRIRMTYEKHVGKKLAATEKFPVMRRFVEVTVKDKLLRDVFWTPAAE